ADIQGSSPQNSTIVACFPWSVASSVSPPLTCGRLIAGNWSPVRTRHIAECSLVRNTLGTPGAACDPSAVGATSLRTSCRGDAGSPVCEGESLTACAALAAGTAGDPATWLTVVSIAGSLQLTS